MKNKIFIGILLVTVGLSGCVRPAGEVDFSEPDVDQIATAIKIIDASITPVGGDSLPTYTPDLDATDIELIATVESVETETSAEVATEISVGSTDVATEIVSDESATPVINAATGTPEPAQPTNTPTAMPPTATTVAQQLPNYAPLDPVINYGSPRFDEEFETDAEWLSSNGKLPDNEYLKLMLVEDGMSVQGTYQDFDTWYFTAPILNDFYIEMTADSKNCSSDDAYGLIMRGSEHNQPAHGYIVGLTCDGDAFIRRIDGINPYSALGLMIPTNTTLIATGQNQINTLGVSMKGEEISVYINGYLFTTLYDDSYLWGRYGVFVKPGPTENYNFVVNQIRVWNLD
jgi:hypothetical protein